MPLIVEIPGDGASRLEIRLRESCALMRHVTIHPRSEENLEKCFLNNENPVIWLAEPYPMVLGLLALSGLFVVHGRLDFDD